MSRMTGGSDRIRCIDCGNDYFQGHADWCKHNPEYGEPIMCTCPDDRGDAGLHHLDCCPLHYEKPRVVILQPSGPERMPVVNVIHSGDIVARLALERDNLDCKLCMYNGKVGFNIDWEVLYTEEETKQVIDSLAARFNFVIDWDESCLQAESSLIKPRIILVGTTPKGLQPKFEHIIYKGDQ